MNAIWAPYPQCPNATGRANAQPQCVPVLPGPNFLHLDTMQKIWKQCKHLKLRCAVDWWKQVISTTMISKERTITAPSNSYPGSGQGCESFITCIIPLPALPSKYRCSLLERTPVKSRCADNKPIDQSIIVVATRWRMRSNKSRFILKGEFTNYESEFHENPLRSEHNLVMRLKELGG